MRDGETTDAAVDRGPAVGGRPVDAAEAGLGAAAPAWAATVHGFLAHGRATADAIARVTAEAPDFALGHAFKGHLLLLLGRSELVAPARAALAAAHAATARTPQTAPARTAAVVAALDAYLAGFPRRAAVILGAWLEDNPGDMLLTKLDHQIRFLMGDRRGMLAMTTRAMAVVSEADAGDDPLHGYRLGAHAFALEENGHYAEAEAAGRAGLERASDDAWGLHAVAHVYDMTAQNAAGIAWLATQQGAWAHCNNFGAHVWWHLALFHLDRGAWDVVLDLYDRRIRAEHTDDYRDIANGASMLARLDVEGVDVGARWDELAALSETRVEPGCVVFADLHYQLALEAGGRRGAADAMIARLAEDASRDEHDMHEVAAVAGLPCARGLTAFRAGHYDLAFKCLRTARAGLQQVGGSHAQRDVFSRLMIEAGIRAGRYAEAEHELAARTARRGAEDGFTARRRTALARARAVTEGVAAE